MGDARTILRGNALGTIHVNDSFARVMGQRSCIIDVSSMAAHLVPTLLLPTGDYPLAHSDPRALMARLERRVSLFPRSKRSSLAYGISKHFVVWYAKACAVRLAPKGIRVLSVSPGTFDTPMAALEEGAAAYLSPLGRIGKPDEIAELLAFCASEAPGYLTGTDIVCDGGYVAASETTPTLEKLRKVVLNAFGPKLIASAAGGRS